MTTEKTAADGRDRGGRFTTGNRIAKGNAMAKRMQEHRAAVAGAISPAALFEVVDGLLKAARSGDAAAARLLLEYTLGKPRPAPLVLDFDLPDLNDAKAVADALKAVTAAVAAGDLDVEAGQQVAGLVAQVATATAWQEVADRVAALERRTP